MAAALLGAGTLSCAPQTAITEPSGQHAPCGSPGVSSGSSPGVASLAPASAMPASASAAPASPASTPPASAAAPAPLGPAAAPASASTPAEERWPGPMAALPFEGGEATYYAPLSEGERPVTVFLHGMCASGKLECPVFAAAARSNWLLCPDGNAGCDGGGWMWSATVKAAEARLATATGALRAGQGTRVSGGPMAIVGYSLGAPAALLQAMREPGRYDRLMIVNASVEPAAAAMKKAGVRRVALVAGARDATASKLRSAAGRLAAAGVEARFFALEATGHYFDGQSATRMVEPLGWLLGP